MHLRQRSGGEGPAIDRREDLVERAAEVALDERPQRLEGPRRHRVVELAQLLDEGRREEVGPRAQHLGDLREAAGQRERDALDFAGRRAVRALPVGIGRRPASGAIARQEQQIAGQDAHNRQRHAQDSDDSEVPDHEAAARPGYRGRDSS